MILYVKKDSIYKCSFVKKNLREHFFAHLENICSVQEDNIIKKLIQPNIDREELIFQLNELEVVLIEKNN